ncbi:MAG: hypothetical protein IJX83_13160 [Lachnospiraceae bacterium]|nr:hypothetical protein [Lachnospiraceae bacterium]
MALFKLKKLKDTVEKSADSIKKSVSDAAEKMPESAKNINISESMKDMAGKGQSMMDILKAKGDELISSRKEKEDETKAAIKNALRDKKGGEAVFSVRDALRIMYCMILIDGNVSEEEEEKFCEIGLACDQDFDACKKQLIDECNGVVQSESAQGIDFVSIASVDSEEYYDQIHDYVGDLIKEENFYQTEGVRAKWLIWNLLAIAYSEGDYSTNERRLMRYIAKKSGVDNTVLLEMEHTFSTLIAIEKEEEWLKSSDRPYKVIEERVVELSNRKDTIMQGINALISD